MSFLDDIAKFAPTIGGVLGGIGGEVVDPFGGGVAGAALGSGLGKAVENESQGKGLGGVSDLEAGAEGGAGQGIGDVAGSAIGAIGSKVADYGANQAEKTSIGDAFGKLSPPEIENYKVPNSIALAKNAGIPTTGSPTDVAQGFVNARGLATGVSGGEKGILNDTLDNIVGQTYHTLGHGVDMSSYGDTVKQALKDNLVEGTEPTTTGPGLPRMTGKAASLSSRLNQALQEKGFGGEGSLSMEAAPQNALELQRSLGTLINQNRADPQATNVIKQVQNYVKNQVYGPDEVTSAIKDFKVPADQASSILKASKGAYGNEDFGNYLINTLNNAEKPSDITDVERQLVDMGEGGQAAVDRNEALAIKPTTSAPEEVVGNAINGDKAGAIKKVFGQGKVRAGVANKAGDLLERMSPFTSTKGIADETQPMLYPGILNKIVNPSVGGKTGVLNKIPGALGATALTSPNVAQGATMNGNAPLNTNMGAPGATAPQGGQLSPYATIMQEIGTDPFLSSSLAPLANTLLPSVQKAQIVESQLPTLSQAFQQAGGAQGPLGGFLAKIGSAFGGGETAKYNAQQKEVMSLLQSLGISGANVPSINESPQAAQAGLSQIQGGLSGILSGVPQ